MKSPLIRLVLLVFLLAVEAALCVFLLPGQVVADRIVWIATTATVQLTLALGLATAIAASEADPSIRAIVLTGVGRKAFCAGADLSGGTGTFTLGLDEPMTDLGKLIRRVREGAGPIPAIYALPELINIAEGRPVF